MKWYTPIEIKQQKGYLRHGSPMLLLGSCFAENVGDYLAHAKFDIDVNPFGTLYNPESIAICLERLMARERFTIEDLHYDGVLWYSYHHHGKFSQPDAGSTLENINHHFDKSVAQLARCERLIITFGTAYVYRLAESGMTVANCHKQPTTLFTRKRLTTEEIIARWSGIIERLKGLNTQCELLFTVSPIRHLRDGAHDNQLSKSTLLLAIDALCQRYSDRCSYFPAYEIVLDELRDYRFYAEDMTHPSSQAVAYICNKLAESCFTDETLRLAERCEKIYRSLRHRPINGTDNTAYRRFTERLTAQMRALETEYPCISFAEEYKQLQPSNTP